MKTLKEHLNSSINEAKNVPMGKRFKGITGDAYDDELTQEVLDSNKHLRVFVGNTVDFNGLGIKNTLDIAPQTRPSFINNLTMRGGTLIVDCDDNNGMVFFNMCDINVDTIVVKENAYSSNHIGEMFADSNVHTKVLKASNLDSFLRSHSFFWRDIRNDVRHSGEKCNVDVLKQLDLGKKPIFDTLLLYWDDGICDGLLFGNGIVVTNNKNFKFEKDEVPVKELKKLPGYYIGCFKIKKDPFDPGY